MFVFFFADSESADYIVVDCNTIIELSSPFNSTNDIAVILRENGIANEGNRSVQLRLVPTTPLDQYGITLYENISLTILDLDSK